MSRLRIAAVDTAFKPLGSLGRLARREAVKLVNGCGESFNCNCGTGWTARGTGPPAAGAGAATALWTASMFGGVGDGAAAIARRATICDFSVGCGGCNFA